MTEEDTVRLRQAVLRLSRELRKTSAEEGLTPTQSSVLSAVVRNEELPLSKLVDGEGLNPTMLSRVVGHLEQRNLLVRVKNEGDRRAASVRATSQGKKLVQRLRNRRTAELQKRLERLDEKSIRELVTALPALEMVAGLSERNE